MMAGPHVTVCSNCGVDVSAGSRFCAACGRSVSSEPSLTRTTPTDERVPYRVIPAAERPLEARARFASDADGLAPGTVLAGRYRILTFIGRGGMGEVYRADDLMLGQPVALKFLPRGLDQQSDRFTRFLAEVRTARQVSHPNVCRVYDIVQSEARTFLAMEYIDGEDLSSLLRRIGRLPPDNATEIARQVCAGLTAAHEKGVLHRDLKPANVMLDGRGRARLTDFGLAGADAGEPSLAGTLVNMAPEQLRGDPASVRTEVYALGLIVHELFTGRRVFDASSLAELHALHERTDTAALSTGFADVNPAVDLVIRRCLDCDPSKRPASALEVATALPGGDPLAAALAAGETPAPMLVAAAGGEGALRPGVAVSLLSAVVALLVAVAFLQPRAQNYAAAPADGPDLLAGRARDLLQRVTNTLPPADSARAFFEDDDVIAWMASRGRAFVTAHLGGERPTPIGFWYRDSPAPMLPVARFVDVGGVVKADDPPMTTSGMRRVVFDARGNLLELVVVPPQVESGGPDTAGPDWTPLFAAAGLDRARFALSPPQWLPPGAFDRRASWSGPAPEQNGVTLHVEGASYRGSPVWFQVVGPWSRPARQLAAAVTRRERAGEVFLTTIFLLLLAICVGLARRNLRLGRGDRQGASRLAVYVFVIAMAGWLFGGTHVPTLYEVYLFSSHAGSSLFIAALIWTTYVALEPIVRRSWPNVNIGWNRLLAGKTSDARVGRDVLVGVAVGLFVLACDTLILVSHPNALADQPPLLRPGGLTSVSGAVAHVMAVQVSAIYVSLAVCLIYVASYAVTRRHWLAGGAIVVVYVALSLLESTDAVSLARLMLIATVQVLVLTRFGLLAATAFWYASSVVSDLPVTADFTRWYAGTGLIAVVVVLSLGVWAFRVSLGGRHLLREV